MVLGAILLIAILLILFLVYTVVVLFFTYWYITIPALVLIIVYKKRKSIWKSRGQNRTFLNEQVKREYYNGTSQDSYQTLPSQTYPSQSDRLIESTLERLGLSEGEAKIVFGSRWRQKLETVGKRDDKLALRILKIQTKIMFDLDYRKEVIHIVDKLIQMIDSVISDNPETAKKYTSDMGPYEELYIHQWKFFKEHKKTTFEEAENIKKEVAYFEKVRDEVKLSSGDLLEMKRFEPAMRQLLDMYIRADDSEQLMDFEELGLIDLVVNNKGKSLENLPEGLRNNEDAMAEAIENNVRKTIVDENPVNPKYFDSMATLLDEIIKQRREQAISYQEYLEQIRALAKKVVNPTENSNQSYPSSVDTLAKQAIYDNFGNDEVLTTKIDTAVRYTKKADWLGDRFKEREIANAVREEAVGYDLNIVDVMELIKAQKEYY